MQIYIYIYIYPIYIQLFICIQIHIIYTNIYIYTHINTYLYNVQQNLSKVTDHGTNFKWSIYGGVQFRELEYRYSGILHGSSFGPQIKRLTQGRGVDLWRWSLREIVLHMCICLYIYIYTNIYLLYMIIYKLIYT